MDGADGLDGPRLARCLGISHAPIHTPAQLELSVLTIVFMAYRKPLPSALTVGWVVSTRAHPAPARLALACIGLYSLMTVWSRVGADGRRRGAAGCQASRPVVHGSRRFCCADAAVPGARTCPCAVRMRVGACLAVTRGGAPRTGHRPAVLHLSQACSRAPGLASRTFARIAFGSRRLEVGRAARRGTALIARASPAKPSLPPTVSETKAKFLKAYSKPVNPISSAIVNELLVQQHLWRYQKRYQYDEVFAVGVCSIFDQVLEELPESEQNALFKAYVTVRRAGARRPRDLPSPHDASSLKSGCSAARAPPDARSACLQALNEDPAKYRADAKRMEAWASELANASGVQPDASGDEGQKTLGKIAERIRAGDFYYTRFFAIGLFRLLEVRRALYCP